MRCFLRWRDPTCAWTEKEIAMIMDRTRMSWAPKRGAGSTRHARTPENTDLSLAQVRAFEGDFGCQCRRQSELLRQNPGRRPGRYPSFITAWGPMLVTIRAFEAPRYESEGGRYYWCVASRMVCSKREDSSDATLRRAEVVIFNQNLNPSARMVGGARSSRRLFDVYIVPHAPQMPSVGYQRSQ